MKSSTTRKHVHRAFTLVELMVTIAIIAMLAGMIMFAMFSAQEAARVSKTRSTIAKLDAIIREKWESYSSRRVPITIPSTFTPRQAAAARLEALREIMRMELPDRWSDIFGRTTTSPPQPTVTGVIPPSIWQAYDSKYTNLSTKPTNQFQSAECLYWIVTMAPAEGGGRELFGESEMGDVDNDGAPEFIDAWGRPIRFLRWAPGLISEFQPRDASGKGTQPDPFDPLRIDQIAPDVPTFALYPLIYSAGPDGGYDIYTGPSVFKLPNANQPYKTKQQLTTEYSLPAYANYDPSNPPPDPAPANDPSNGVPDATTALTDVPIGKPSDVPDNYNGNAEWYDNITNHLIGAR